MVSLPPTISQSPHRSRHPARPTLSSLFGNQLFPSLLALLLPCIVPFLVQGGNGKGHWSYSKPLRPPVPAVHSDWVRNPIDAFVLARLAAEGCTPAPEASQEVLLRRASLTVAGLPPALGERARFLEDEGSGAYERLVDRLLASPHYGERMAVMWLDLARYADSNGYHADGPREIWAWRDWVIDAFNQNLPFSRFAVEQLAGDLLPGATDSQRVATGFNRNVMVNFEGGADPEEYRTRYVVDRVDTTATVFLGLTLACAECHDHKFDPISQKEFFQFYAFFNNVAEQGIDGFNPPDAAGFVTPAPLLKLRTPAQVRRLEALERSVAELERQLERLQGTSAPVAELAATETALTEARRQATELVDSFPVTMVMQELRDARETRVLLRGDFRNPGQLVAADVPSVLPPLPEQAPRNRLGLAQWLVSGQNPLVARVVVNRLWQEIFGIGLVKTSDDFGVQGDPPSHPELLDWLAVEFMESGWDVKRMIRMMVTSATFRQTERVPAERVRADPENRLLGRGPTRRLAAEFIRDNALALSGLLDLRLGGPSVFPYQPPGLWEPAFAPGVKNAVYAQSQGGNNYRRGLYTHWKRKVPYPSFVVFDAPDRQVCTVRRQMSNTPLQALVLMNDPVYLEAARALGRRLSAWAAPDPDRGILIGFRHCLARTPHPAEQAELRDLYADELRRFTADPNTTRQWFGDADATPELAAWMAVAHVLLCLDETITRP